MQGFKKFIDDLKIFVKREPFYLWVVIFILLINLMIFFSNLSKETKPEESPKMSRAKILIEERAKVESAIIKDEKMAVTGALVVTGIMFVIFVGLLLDFVILIRKKDMEVLVGRSHSPPKVGWSIWDALKVIILFIFFGYIISIIEGVILSPIFPSMKANERIVSIANTTIMDFIAMSMVFYFAILRYKNKIRDLGLSLKNFFKNIYYGLLGYISVIPVLVATLIITVLFLDLIKYRPTPQPILEIFLEEEKEGVLTYLSLFVAVAGPVMEEIFFRGFLYNAIKKETGIKSAIFISAILFSFLHAHVIGFLPILILGVSLAYLYERTGSLIPSITVHVIHNLIMIFLIFLIKGVKI